MSDIALVTTEFVDDIDDIVPLQTVQEDNRVICRGTFTKYNSGTEQDDALDPTDGVYLVVISASGVESTYEYSDTGTGTIFGVEIRRSSAGVYYVILDAITPGYIYARWYCTGTEKGSDEKRLRVSEVNTTSL